MTKIEFVKAVASKTDATQKDVSAMISAMSDVIIEALKGGDSFKFGDVGTFSVRDVEEREARNPATGGTITVPAHKAPKFKYSSTAKAEIR